MVYPQTALVAAGVILGMSIIQLAYLVERYIEDKKRKRALSLIKNNRDARMCQKFYDDVT